MQLPSRASAPLTARENWSSIVDMAIDAQEDYAAKKEKRKKADLQFRERVRRLINLS